MSLSCEECVKTDNHCCLADIPLDVLEGLFLSKLAKDIGIDVMLVEHPKFNEKLVILPKDTPQGTDITHIPCAFLKDGRCSVYENRPFICRSYGTEFIKCRYEVAGITAKEEIESLSVEEIKKLDSDSHLASGAKSHFDETQIYRCGVKK